MHQTCVLEIVVPLKNEAGQIPDFLSYAQNVISSFNGEVSFSFINDHSVDQTYDLLIEKKNEYFKVLSLDAQHGIMAAFKLGAELSRADFCLLLPVDCCLHVEDLKTLISYLTSETDIQGGFGGKAYIKGSWVLNFYSLLQNKLLATNQVLAVWTNGLYFKRSFLLGLHEDEFPSFLQDVYLFKKFKGLGHDFKYHAHKIHVSARKYNKDGEVRRIWQNFLILFLYFCGYSQMNKLKTFYQTKKVRHLF